MPLVTISSLTPLDTSAIAQMIADVRESGAQALQCSPNNVWAMFQPLALGSYDKDLPPVVIIKAQSGRSPAQRESFVKAVANCVGKGLSIPSDKVWIHYQEMRPQDVWFEGHWAG